MRVEVDVLGEVDEVDVLTSLLVSVDVKLY